MWRPLLRFVLLGGVLFAAQRVLLAEPARRPEPVVLSAARLEALRIEALRRGSANSEQDLAALVQEEVDDELLVRAARAAGLDRDDPVVQQRLVQNMRFAGAAPERSDASLLEEARELGLDRSDPVVRRRLVQVMRMGIEARAPAPEPGEAELRARYEADAARQLQPARTRLVQLYFAREHEAEARRALARLRAAGAGPEAIAGIGEGFLHPAEQPPQSDEELAARFGATFASAVARLAPGAWDGPVASAYGLHLVYVRERTPASRVPFESVREPLRLTLLAERRAKFLAEELRRMRAGVEVVIAPEKKPAPAAR